MKTTYNEEVIIEYLLLLKDHKRTQKNLDGFKEKHKEDVENYWWNEKRDEILKKLPKFIKTHTIWCRNGSICHLAKPCNNINCIYKESNYDIINGCSKCQNFQVTNSTDRWDETVHVDWNSD